MGRLGDKRGRKEGRTSMGIACLTKATSQKWELSEPIRSERLTSPKKRSEHERQRRHNAIV